MTTTAAPIQVRNDVEVIGRVGLAHGTSHFFHLMLPGPLFPWLMKDFSLSYTEAGMLMTLFFVVSGVGQAVAGFVVDREQLATSLDERLAAARRWRQIYWDEFIPFAHGVRRLAVYYNDAVHPDDPYEFVGLLQGESLLAIRRNAAIAALADEVRCNAALKSFLLGAVTEAGQDRQAWWARLLQELRRVPDGGGFAERLAAPFAEHIDVAYGAERLSDRPELILHSILELARSAAAESRRTTVSARASASALEERLMQAVRARENARRNHLEDRVHFQVRDASDPLLAGQYDLVSVLEALHDMNDPVGALRTMHRLAKADGTVLVVDERVGDTFTARGNDIEWMMYGWSILHCLPVGMTDENAAGTGTVMRADTLRKYARQAGFRKVEILPIEDFFFRFYRLTPWQ